MSVPQSVSQFKKDDVVSTKKDTAASQCRKNCLTETRTGKIESRVAANSFHVQDTLPSMDFSRPMILQVKAMFIRLNNAGTWLS